MRSRRQERQQLCRLASIALAILGMLHTPLPQPDFHPIRHHDGPGEVCEKHDHLLRWHPDAGAFGEVAVLHWHWLLPLTEGADSTPLGSGPAVHAHMPDWQVATAEQVPQVVPDLTSNRLSAEIAAGIANGSPLLDWLPPAGILTGPGLFDDGDCRPRSFRATFARREQFSSLLQRWVC